MENSKHAGGGLEQLQQPAGVVLEHLQLQCYDNYFILKKDAMGCFSGYQKCTAALRKRAYGVTADSWHEYLWMSESTCGNAMVRFATSMVVVFGPRYMIERTVADTERLLAISEPIWWPGLLGSLECMH
ncbi:uncharacterized protein [Aegilops tauschii subsp. strangulata]|uniref:uncharacterized protein n=1 Tax=Aegilops tauschii subsp. strangulata TaxID=200361 RepID=UPI003CC8DF82